MPLFGVAKLIFEKSEKKVELSGCQSVLNRYSSPPRLKKQRRFGGREIRAGMFLKNFFTKRWLTHPAGLVGCPPLQRKSR
jgi:hypothetical protein